MTIEALAERARVSVRTVRYYISQGLLPGPGARGRAASYGAEHLARLRLVRRLSDQHVPLNEQRQQLARLSAPEINELLTDEEQREAVLDKARQALSPRSYVAQLLEQARARRPDSAPQPLARHHATQDRQSPHSENWLRWDLAPGLELHVRSDAAKRHAQLIEQFRRLASEAPERTR